MLKHLKSLFSVTWSDLTLKYSGIHQKLELLFTFANFVLKPEKEGKRSIYLILSLIHTFNI